MKVSSLIGLVVALAGLFLGATMEGSNPMAILAPSALLIVLGGTLGATITAPRVPPSTMLMADGDRIAMGLEPSMVAPR
jgi:chemotaxis protein MotA